MIVGVGTDILQISRMQRSLQRTPGLLKRILTPAEQLQCSRSARPYLFLAKRFCAKEAIAKALGTGIGRGVSWQHLQIDKDANGRPLVLLSEGAEQRAAELGISRIQLSYSDEREYVVAFAIAES
ncbi:holo-ACP synthase [Neptuniibacter halophilus]|uniref:holo-ACP synthase n=1 Tax=Neptuniibacter halophilus TaxID=651666 RepID=UPI002572871B|nr:holo-ACP synthase [Neptuniibacter halophilus]